MTFKPANKTRGPIPGWVYEHRLLSRVEVDDNGCWRWTGPIAPNGYANTIRAWGKGWLPHRLAFTVMVAPIEAELQIDHTCRVRDCISPFHLEQVTQAENLRRQGAAVTHCPRRHEYTEANTYRGKKGLRVCRECSRIRNREAARRRRLAA
jgi:hypothetical protein